MIFVTDCGECKNRLPKIDGWLACCKAFPNGYPKDFNFNNLKERKECNNGIGFEPIIEQDDIYTVLDGSNEEASERLKKIIKQLEKEK